MPKTTIGVKLDTEIRDRLKALGALRDRSTHWLVKEAVTRYLTEEETYEQERAEDRERWERYVESGRYLTTEQVSERMKRFADLAQERLADKG